MTAGFISRVMEHKDCDLVTVNTVGDVLAGNEAEVFADMGLERPDLVGVANAVIPEIKAMGV